MRTPHIGIGHTFIVFVAIGAVFVARGAVAQVPPDRVFTFDQPTLSYTDLTSKAANAEPNDVPLGGNDESDMVYFGSFLPFQFLTMIISSATAGGTIEWQYSTASAWSVLPGYGAPSPEQFRVAGERSVLTTLPPTDWAPRERNGVTRYWLRAVWATARGGFLAPEPRLSQATIIPYNLRVRVEDELGNPLIGLSPEHFSITNCSDTRRLLFRTFVDGVYELALPITGPDLRCDVQVVNVADRLPSSVQITDTLSAVAWSDLSSTPFVVPLAAVSSGGVTVDRASLPADGSSFATVTVSVWNAVGYRLVGKSVSLTSVRETDTILAVTNPTNSNGEAVFRVSSNTAGSAHLFATSEGVNLEDVFLTFTAVPPAGDVTPPVVGAVTPTTAIADVATSFSVSYADNVGVVLCTLSVDGLVAGNLALPGGVSGSGSMVVTLAAGAHTLRAACADAAENAAEGPATTVTASAPVIPADTTPSGATTIVIAAPTTVSADGSSASAVTVTVKNAAGQPLGGKLVSLASSRSGLDAISVVAATTDSLGRASFAVRSTSTGTSVLTAIADGVAVVMSATVTFQAPAVVPPPGGAGRRVKLPCPFGAGVNHPCKAVYYVSRDGARHAFPNERVYFTWYPDFSGIDLVSAAEMASYPLRRNVTYRPGMKMVKFVTLPKVYVVARGGMLRWVPSEDAAAMLYGSQWGRSIDDVNDAFYLDYRFGADLTVPVDFIPASETAAVLTIDDDFVERGAG